MFGTRQSSSDNSSLEQLIKRATDETLTSDNWQYILEVCDNISSNPENGTKQAIGLISTRVASKDANIILRTLSLLVAVAENCGSRMRQEIATTSFLQESLIKRFSDRRLHKTVKIRIAEVIKQLHESFKNDPSLKPMTDAYNRVVSEHGKYLQENADGPAKPAKKEKSRLDKVKEEEDLQRVLKLSLQEYEREQSVKKSYLNLKPLPEAQQETRVPSAPEAQKPVEMQTIATVSKVRALYDLISYEPDELSFRKGDIITVIESVYRDWWRGSLPNGKSGIFPLNYVTPLVTKSPEELSRELQEENKVLSVELKKIDKLLAMLSSNPETVDEDEITRLYGEIIPLRTSLAKFINKYSVRKEELMALNTQLNSEAKLYNDLMDKSVSLRVNHQPSGFQAPPYPTARTSSHNAFAPNNPNQLHQQPTSSGFGNASYNNPNEFYGSPSVPNTSFNQGPTLQQHTRAGSYEQQQYHQNYLNINKFPDVNNI